MQKYKVFLNEKRIVFSSPAMITFAKTSSVSPAFTDGSEVLTYLESLLKTECREAVIEHEHPEKAFECFQSALLNVAAAGGVVKRKDRILFIFRNGKWDLPKGKIDKGESASQAALREVAEECGISGHAIVKALPTTFHIYQSPYRETKGKWIFKPTHWFEMEYNGTCEGLPETDEGITEVRWFHRSELDEVLANTYENLKELIRMYA